jgi:hypothetical protein
MASVQAETTGVVYGHAYYSADNSTPANNEVVVATCYQNADGIGVIETVEDTTGTPWDGWYRANFQTCVAGNYVQSCVGTDCSEIGILKIQNSHIATERLNIFNIDHEVPEFGLIAGMVALVGGLVGFFVLRKK